MAHGYPRVSAPGQAPRWVPIGLPVPLLTSWFSLSFVKFRLAPAKIQRTWAGYPYGRMATQPKWPNAGCLICVGSDHSLHTWCTCTCHMLIALL